MGELMSKDEIKRSLLQGNWDLDEIFGDLAQAYVESKEDDYKFRAAESNSHNYLGGESYKSHINSLKQSDLSKFKQNIKQNFYSNALDTYNLITESQKIHPNEHLSSFLDKLFKVDITRLDEDLNTSTLTFFNITPDEIRAVISLAKNLIQIHRLYEAKKVLDYLKYFDPENYELWKTLGYLNLEMDKLDDSLNCFYKAYSVNPNHPQSYLGILEVYLLQGKINEARDLFVSLYKNQDLDESIKRDLNHFIALKRGVIV